VFVPLHNLLDALQLRFGLVACVVKVCVHDYLTSRMIGLAFRGLCFQSLHHKHIKILLFRRGALYSWSHFR